MINLYSHKISRSRRVETNVRVQKHVIADRMHLYESHVAFWTSTAFGGNLRIVRILSDRPSAYPTTQVLWGDSL